VVYVKKCFPHSMSTPEEAFTGNKPDVSHFKIFGSSVYVHLTKNARNKQELTAKVGIFVGYTETPHNYCVYFPNYKMIVMRQDIKFDEGKAMHLSLEREIDLHVEEELLVPKDESQDVDQPHEEVHGVEEATHEDPSIRNGLKQAPQSWYTRIDSYFTELGFTKSEADANLYQIVVDGRILIIVLYVDDLILTGDEKLIHSCNEDLTKEFEIKDMGLLHYFLGLKIWQRDGQPFVFQGKYTREILGKFHMDG
jgi:hypothetical protein